MMMNKTYPALAALALALGATAASAEKIKFDYWYGLTGDLGAVLAQTCDRFNASQDQYEAVCTGYDGYENVVQSAIAAFRAGKAPTLLQSFDAGTADLMMSGQFYAVTQMMKDYEIAIDWADYFPGIANYYSSSKGEMFSMPFNSSTAVMYYNTDDLAAVNMAPPANWEEFGETLKALKAKNPEKCAYAYEPSVWVDLEQYSAINNVPLASNNNGYDGLDTTLLFNTTSAVKHMEDIKSWLDAGLAEMKVSAGGMNSQEAFSQNLCSFFFGSIANHSSLHQKHAEDLKWDVAMIPTEKGVERHNSVVGGASLWVLANKSEEEYRGVAEYLKFIATPEEITFWVSNTGYIPVTNSAFETLSAEGFYSAAPFKGREVAIASLTATVPGPLNRGFRLGSMIQIRAEWLSEVQAALAGDKTVQEAYDTAAERGNVLLAKFAKTYADKTLP
jgi:sn-glycerol 3-phosphate transport system substrate-binding protein